MPYKAQERFAMVRGEKDWKTFEKEVQMETDDQRNKERFESTDPAYQRIDLDEARSKGITPLPYTAAPESYFSFS